MIISREEYLELRKLKKEYFDYQFTTGLYYDYPCYINDREEYKQLDSKYFSSHGRSSSGHHIKLKLDIVTRAIEDFEQSYQEVYKKFL